MLSYIAVGQGESIGRTKYQLIEKLLQPCGPPPAKIDDEGMK